MLDAEKTDPARADPASPEPSEGAVVSHVELPPVPPELAHDPVAAWAEPLSIDTYLPLEPSEYPEFFDLRVYQGSSGRVYPLPFHERIEQTKRPHLWEAVHLENEWVRLVILPELGGRIYIGYDKTADYDFFYRNNVIKPALVGLAGPWVSGGVEFNWPQHHRPATFLPTDWEIEREADGSVTVWCSDHDPFTRMKGMHGIRLRPDSSVIEARVRLYNRTDQTQTFLWWANVAAAVNDDYQSFFPTDVHYVADHAKRAITTFPQVEGCYYGVDYPAQVTPERPDGDRLDWYRNIPVPTSYMVLGTRDDFFGGYDHGRRAGFVHVADRGIAPGKKQWTWGSAEFGQAWDRNLTDTDGPYVELMAGVFTDNQPDFSFLAPGETKTFSQYWYPIAEIGPAHQANRDVAMHLDVSTAETVTDVVIGLVVTRPVERLRVQIVSRGDVMFETIGSAGPGAPVVLTAALPGAYRDDELTIRVLDGSDILLDWGPAPALDDAPPHPATEPPEPSAIGSNDELYLTGQYLQQYRHATRSPEPYWREALTRDPGDVRVNVAIADLLERRGRLAEAENHLRRAVDRLLERVPNPADGEALYRLGINLIGQGRDDESKDLLAKAAWNAAWRVPAHYALAKVHARARAYDACLRSLDDLLTIDPNHLQANCVRAIALRASGHDERAAELLESQLLRDPLDQWTRHLAGRETSKDAPTLLDIALEYASVGCVDGALEVLDRALEASALTSLGQVQVAPLIHYHRALILHEAGRDDESSEALSRARTADARHCLASRLVDVAALEFAVSQDPGDARAAALLGNWHYDKGNYAEATDAWTTAVAGELSEEESAVSHRNLAVAAYNVDGDAARAHHHFESAIALRPDDAKLIHEHDQLLARTGYSAQERRARIELRPDLIGLRDDLTVEYADLLTALGMPGRARELLASRVFQPWEGGEGLVLGAWERAQLGIARAHLGEGRSGAAIDAVRDAIAPPLTLGEARHPLANAAELYWVLGEAYEADGDGDAARAAWERAVSFSADFTNMAVQPYSDKTYWSIRALRALGRPEEADALASELAEYTDSLRGSPARIDYFATSLPTLLLFHDDPDSVRAALVARLDSQLEALAVG